MHAEQRYVDGAWTVALARRRSIERSNLAIRRMMLCFVGGRDMPNGMGSLDFLTRKSEEVPLA